ncbi:MAG: hypothetical protein E7302_08025 [Butyrivibrio sp.]|nr:hypothetical protein [Butyrivibrio sp.]
MYIKFEVSAVQEKYKLQSVVIEPDGANMDILGNYLARTDFLIDNPAKTFAKQYKAGVYDKIPQEKLAVMAECANELSNAFLDSLDDESSALPTINVYKLIANLSTLYLQKV